MASTVGDYEKLGQFWAKRRRNHIAELEAELEREVAALREQFDPERAELETISIKPYKKDIAVEAVGLLWLPYDERERPMW